MKIQCQLCKEIVAIGPFSPSDDGIQIQCAACRGAFFLPRSGSLDQSVVPAGASGQAVASAANDDDDLGETDECPKCGERVALALTACASCGLLREHFDSFARDAKDSEDGELVALWTAVEGDWASAEAHEAFIARASSTGDYAAAAKQYRRALKTRPGDAIATGHLERVTKMAEVAILAKRPEAVDEPAGPYRGVVILLVLILALGGVAGIYALAKGKDAEGVKQKAPVKAAPSQPAKTVR